MDRLLIEKSLFAVVAVSVVLMSCQNEQSSTNCRANKIGVSVSSENGFVTKALQEPGTRIDEFVFEDADGQSICVELFESDYTGLPFGTEETKGSIVDDSSMNVSGSKFIVNAWLGSENRYSGGPADGLVYYQDDASNYHFIINGNASKGSEWSLKDSGGNDYIWRNAVPTTFWSHYPVSVPAKVSRSITFPGSQASDTEQKKISFSYSIGTNANATDLKDLMFAYNLEKVEYEDGVTDHGKLVSGSESINIHFYHALPAIRFDVSGLLRRDKEIKAITLEGIVSSGTCNVEGVAGELDFSNWTLGSGKATVRQEFTASDFTLPSLDDNPTTGNPTTAALQAFSNGKIFFPLPQAVKNSGIKVTIEYSHTDDDVVLTKSFVLDHETSWQSGKLYTYRLSVSGVDLYVNDKVTGNVKNNLVIKNVGAEPAYIRAMLSGNWVNKDGDILMEWDPEDTATGTIVWGTGYADWTKGADGLYYHQASVAPGASASQLFESYTVLNRPSILEDSDYLEFIITAQSVLADEGKVSAIEAWGSTAASYLD